MAGELAGKVAVITGASSGMGRATALEFTRAGAKAVVVADVTEVPREGGEKTTDLVASLGGQAVFVRTDVSRPVEVEEAIATAQRFGGLDIMVNNAGVFRSGPVEDLDEDTYDLLFDVNVKGVAFGTRAAVRAMTERGGGAIINLSSTAALHGTPGFAAYSAAKAAIRLFSYGVAAEVGGRGIRVNVIHPGFVDTAMSRFDLPGGAPVSTPLGRIGEPEDVARTAVWLAGDAAGYVTGTSIVVDGGLSRGI